MKINGALRQSSRQMPDHLFAGLRGNKYVSMMHALVSGVIKLSLICILPANGEVFRGLSGFELPRCFHEPDRFGARGGVDFAFMSCTTDMKVALDYSKGDGALVFRISVGMIDRGADLRFLSQYPGEREIVMPPRSCLEVRGEPHLMSTDHGDVVIFDAAINCNLSCRTLGKTKAQRKDLIVSLIDTLAKEVSRDIKTQSHAPEFVERTKRDVFWEREKSGEIFLNSITEEISRMTDIYRERSTEWYLDDAHLQKAVTGRRRRRNHAQVPVCVCVLYRYVYIHIQTPPPTHSCTDMYIYTLQKPFRSRRSPAPSCGSTRTTPSSSAIRRRY